MRRPLRPIALGILLAAGALASSACGARTGLDVPDAAGPAGAGGGTCTGAACACGPTAVLGFVSQGPIDKIDLLLAVDNSASMADKQQILALAIPDLVNGLVNPKCLDDVTNLPVAMQPAGPLMPCPVGSTRDFTPVLDIHIGLVSSSLGTFGADGCEDPKPSMPCGPGSTNNDHGHLVTRSDACGQMAPVPTYENLRFLAWDPAQKLTPPGEANVGDPTAIPPVPGLATSLHDLVVGDGQLGCGFESQDESWFRFLVDPTPYQTISLVNNTVVTSGTDTVLLQQRADFLRPDSLLAVVVVSDETDTSIKEQGEYPLFGESTLHLPLPRPECAAKGPLDPCCASCGDATPPGCPDQPSCTVDGMIATYTDANEEPALRGFGLISHKQRYGIEFFYQPSRYVAALTSATVTDANGNEVVNPIFSNLDPNQPSGPLRDPTLVYYAAIVGVPWQLIARQKDGVPDLLGGVSALDASLIGGFKTSKELDLTDAQGNTFWDDIAGDPEHYVAARSPFMQESTLPRSGTDPITGAALSPPSTPNGMGAVVGGSLINDHERSISMPAGDIEYACVFPIPTPIDCSVPGAICDCPPLVPPATTTDSPLCAPNPNDSGNPTLQTSAKAYPGVKELAIARGLGDQGIAASICAKQVTDPTADDFGYRPAVKALLDRLHQTLGGQCLAQKLTPDAEGQVACSVLEARHTSDGACSCDSGMDRFPVPAADQCYEQAALADPRAKTAQWNCFCEITQASGADLGTCQSALEATDANGWCYVDPGLTPPLGNPALVKGCPWADRRLLRFVGAGTPLPGSTVFVGCK